MVYWWIHYMVLHKSLLHPCWNIFNKDFSASFSAQKSSDYSINTSFGIPFSMSPQSLISLVLLGLTVVLSGGIYMWVLRYVCIGCFQPVAVDCESEALAGMVWNQCPHHLNGYQHHLPMFKGAATQNIFPSVRVKTGTVLTCDVVHAKEPGHYIRACNMWQRILYAFLKNVSFLSEVWPENTCRKWDCHSCSVVKGYFLILWWNMNENFQRSVQSDWWTEKSFCQIRPVKMVSLLLLLLLSLFISASLQPRLLFFITICSGPLDLLFFIPPPDVLRLWHVIPLSIPRHPR